MDNSPTKGGEPKDNMADDILDKIDASSDDSDVKGKQKKTESAPSQDDWKQLVGDKFKSEADLAKGYKELEEKFGKSSEEVRQTREFAEVINPLLEEIRADPEIFAKLDERLRKRGQPNNPSTADAKGNEKATGQDEMRVATSDLLLARFEEKYGINKLPPEERKVLRQRIGDAIYENTGQSLDRIDLRRLGTVLENAYVLANKDELIEKSKLEALASAQGAQEASIPGLPSSPGKSEETLTPEEGKTADRLGLTREQYLEGKKGLAKVKS